MLELMVGVAVVVMLTRIASIDGQSAPVWGLVTFALCVASLWVPLPFLRFVLAGLIVFVAMIVYKIIAERQP